LRTAMYSVRDVGEVLSTTSRILTFRRAVPDLERLGPLYLGAGLLFACLAGIGRHLDNPRVPWQHLGLDSVGYVFVFAGILWLILSPIMASNWRYSTVLIFVALTSPPAFLYILPDFFLPTQDVPTAKTVLLAVVATWRVALLMKFLSSPSFGIGAGEAFVATFLPLVLIVVVLVFLNLDRAVFDFMGGGGQQTANDGAYAVLLLITVVSLLLCPFLLLPYLWICWTKWREPS
jgi:hypothetical protein